MNQPGRGNIFNTVQLLRFPFSYFLMPVFFFALSQAQDINWLNAVICFMVLHLFIYPASNGYNSYMDQDETSIGGLEHPPKPTRQLFYASVLFDFLGLLLSCLVSIWFMLSVLTYILASRAYSYKGIRLKKYPILGFLVVVLFQGGFTFFMVYNGISRQAIQFTGSFMLIITACSFLIGGVYPLTQIYQHEADVANGDYTISYKLGVRGTFIFTAVLFIISAVLLYFYFVSIGQINQFIIFQAMLLPVIIYFIYWFILVIKNEEQASFKNTMRMNMIASTCMNVCFLLLTFLNQNR